MIRLAGSTFWYLATPYARFPDGREAAFQAAVAQTALLCSAGIPVFSPIVYGHPLDTILRITPATAHRFWLAFNEPFMRAAHGLIVCTLPSWERSRGMSEEIWVFNAQCKPVVWMQPGVVPEALRPSAEGPAP